MLVYGDHVEHRDAQEFSHQLNRRLREVMQSKPGVDRHSRLVGVLVDAGRLLQGVADAALAQDQRDRPTSAIDQVTVFLAAVAAAVCRSWQSGFDELGFVPELGVGSEFPGAVAMKLPEGFAFYAVYPEAFFEAAERLRLNAAPRVIGIRSIGTSLAAIAASGLGAEPPVTVRPFGDPHARRIALDPALELQLLDGDAHYLIVDEGPGLSGSSFAAVADWLRDRGVRDDRIAIVSSHGEAPGCAASPERQRWWRDVQREVGDLSLQLPALLKRWCADQLGWHDVKLHDVSGGEWRRWRFQHEQDWPPAITAWERRKFIADVGGERFLLKFAGLGEIGEAKLRLARMLHAEGLVPEPVALVHGFLVERWLDASTLAEDDVPLESVAQYVATRAMLPAGQESGASLEVLLDMTCRNVGLALGRELAAAHRAAWECRIADLGQRVNRVQTDNKLDRTEWLRAAGGELIKTDSLDHHQAHDVIGSQDIAWDAAGAIVEFRLGEDDRGSLLESISQSGGGLVDPDLLQFYLTAYPAFRLGQVRLAAAMTSNAEEKLRLANAEERYAKRLQSIA